MGLEFLFTNNAASRLLAALSSSATSFQVLPGDGVKFPTPGTDQAFMVTIEDRRTGQLEICKCTHRNTDTLDVVRGQEGTIAQTFQPNAIVSHRMTAGTLDWFMQTAINNAGYTTGAADAKFVDVTGDTMSGPLQLPGAPTLNTHAATKKYVDDVAAALDASKIGDANVDGNYYARRDGSWQVVSSGIGDAPVDGKIYGRLSSSWVEAVPRTTYVSDINAINSSLSTTNSTVSSLSTQVTSNTSQIASNTSSISTLNSTKIGEAPNDGNYYARRNQSWQLSPSGGGGGGITEAPSTGSIYGRRGSDATWQLIPGGGISDVPNDGIYYVRRSTGVAAWVDADTIFATDAALTSGLATKLNSSAYTAVDVLSKLLTVDGSASGLDADLLDGNDSVFYRNAGNLNAGTLPAARFDDTAHGVRTGGTLHALVVAGGASGFMSGTDKTKLDGLSVETGATILAKLITVDGAGSALDADLLDGNDSTFYRNATNLNTGTLPSAQFTDTSHGNRSGGTLHANATSVLAGFMSATDKAKLDTMTNGPFLELLGGTMTGPIVLPSTGTAAATPLNFGTPGTGIFGDATTVKIAASGAQRASFGPTLLLNTPISAPNGNAASVAYHFGTAGTGLFGTNTAVFMATAGVQRFGIDAAAATLAVPLVLPSDPVSALQAVTKQYVDNRGATALMSDTAPSSPANGQLWVDTTTMNLFVYYNDGTSSQWVQLAGV